jgi:hypothetical protein
MGDWPAAVLQSLFAFVTLSTMSINYENRPLLDERSFETVLDITCKRLWNKKVQYSIKQIDKMEAHLLSIEKDLDLFLFEHTEDL